MSDIPSELRYTATHEWARLDEEEDLVVIGISDYAQKLLGDIVFVELPEVEINLREGEECGVVESVKAASEIYSPITGEVIEVNNMLTEQPGLINSDPYGGGWIVKIKPHNIDDWEELMDAQEYADKIEAEE